MALKKSSLPRIRPIFPSWPRLLLFAAAAASLQSCLTVRPHRRQPTRLPHPWDSPGKNTGVGCHFLLSRPLLFCVMGWELIKFSHSRTSTQESGPYPGCLLSFHRFALDILRAGALKRFSDTFGAARSAQPDFRTGHREQVRTASIRVNRCETESSRGSKKGGRSSGLGVRERL